MTVTTNTLSTVPAVVEQAAAEDITWGLDATPLLIGPQTPTVPGSLLTDLSTQTTVVLTDAPAVVGNLVNQRIRPGVLVAQHTYRLQVTFTPAGTTNILDMALGIRCPF